jgi:hypothetical protein
MYRLSAQDVEFNDPFGALMVRVESLLSLASSGLVRVLC